MEQTRTERTLDEIRQAIKGLAGDEATMETETVKAGSRRLEVTVMSARHLPKMDTFGSIDPFCEVRLGAVAFKTTVRKNTYTPEWSETFTFQMLDSTTAGQPLKIALYDWDMVGDNERVGTADIAAGKIAELMQREVGSCEDEALIVLDDAGQPVYGKDKKAAVVQLRLRVLDGIMVPIIAGPGGKGHTSGAGLDSLRLSSASGEGSAVGIVRVEGASDTLRNSTSASWTLNAPPPARRSTASVDDEATNNTPSQRRFSVSVSAIDSDVLKYTNALDPKKRNVHAVPALGALPPADLAEDRASSYLELSAPVKTIDAFVCESPLGSHLTPKECLQLRPVEDLVVMETRCCCSHIIGAESPLKAVSTILQDNAEMAKSSHIHKLISQGSDGMRRKLPVPVRGRGNDSTYECMAGQPELGQIKPVATYGLDGDVRSEVTRMAADVFGEVWSSKEKSVLGSQSVDVSIKRYILASAFHDHDYITPIVCVPARVHFKLCLPFFLLPTQPPSVPLPLSLPLHISSLTFRAFPIPPFLPICLNSSCPPSVKAPPLTPLHPLSLLNLFSSSL